MLDYAVNPQFLATHVFLPSPSSMLPATQGGQKYFLHPTAIVLSCDHTKCTYEHVFVRSRESRSIRNPSALSNSPLHIPNSKLGLMQTPTPIPFDPFSKPSFENAARVVGAVNLKSLTKRSTEWLWPQRIPIGEITLLVGDPGLGKSLVALDIAARVSTATPWPDNQPAARSEDSEDPATQTLAPSSVLLLNAEDNLASTVLPRLEALGADSEKSPPSLHFLVPAATAASRATTSSAATFRAFAPSLPPRYAPRLPPHHHRPD